MTDPMPEEKPGDNARDAARYRWLRRRLELRYLPYNAGLPFHPFSIRLSDEFQAADPDPLTDWQDRSMFEHECAKLDAAIDSRLPVYGNEKKRWVVEPKSRGFAVIDISITARAEGFCCFCVDQSKAEMIARLLNRQDKEVV